VSRADVRAAFVMISFLWGSTSEPKTSCSSKKEHFNLPRAIGAQSSTDFILLIALVFVAFTQKRRPSTSSEHYRFERRCFYCSSHKLVYTSTRPSWSSHAASPRRVELRYVHHKVNGVVLLLISVIAGCCSSFGRASSYSNEDSQCQVDVQNC
jgi:hypothetical protein